MTHCCGMYPAGKVDISQHLAIPGFPQSDHTVGKLSVDAGSLCCEPQVILKCQPPICLYYRSAQTNPAVHIFYFECIFDQFETFVDNLVCMKNRGHSSSFDIKVIVKSDAIIFS